MSYMRLHCKGEPYRVDFRYRQTNTDHVTLLYKYKTREKKLIKSMKKNNYLDEKWQKHINSLY